MKYVTRCLERPFMKLKLVEPQYVLDMQLSEARRHQHRQFVVQQDKLSLVGSYIKQAGLVLKNYVAK